MRIPWVVFQLLKPPPNGRNKLRDDHEHVAPTFWHLRIDHHQPVRIVHELITYPGKNLPHVALKMFCWGASLVAQWIRICLPMQETQVRALVREDPTCRGAAKPMCHNYWACALEPASHNYWAREPQLLSPQATTTEARTPRARAPQQEKPLQWEAHTLQRKVAPARCN